MKEIKIKIKDTYLNKYPNLKEVDVPIEDIIDIAVNEGYAFGVKNNETANWKIKAENYYKLYEKYKKELEEYKLEMERKMKKVNDAMSSLGALK